MRKATQLLDKIFSQLTDKEIETLDLRMMTVGRLDRRNMRYGDDYMAARKADGYKQGPTALKICKQWELHVEKLVTREALKMLAARAPDV